MTAYRLAVVVKRYQSSSVDVAMVSLTQVFCADAVVAPARVLGRSVAAWAGAVRPPTAHTSTPTVRASRARKAVSSRVLVRGRPVRTLVTGGPRVAGQD